MDANKIKVRTRKTQHDGCNMRIAFQIYAPAPNGNGYRYSELPDTAIRILLKNKGDQKKVFQTVLEAVSAIGRE